MTDYLILFLIVLAIHLTPAFTPPTWPIILLYSFDARMPLGLLVVIAAAGAACGRVILARLSRVITLHLSAKSQRNLAAVGRVLEQRKRHRILALGLFVVTPVPSAQLFEAAGMAGLRLRAFTLAFFAGRLGFYSLYALTGQQLRETSIGQTLRHSLLNPAVFAVQFLMIALLVALVRIEWSQWLGERPSEEEPPAQ